MFFKTDSSVVFLAIVFLDPLASVVCRCTRYGQRRIGPRRCRMALASLYLPYLIIECGDPFVDRRAAVAARWRPVRSRQLVDARSGKDRAHVRRRKAMQLFEQ